MLSAQYLRSHPELTTALVVASAGVTGFIIWRTLENVRERQAKWQKIEELQQSELEFRTQLKERLALDATKHQAICEMSFDQLVEQLQSGNLTALEALHAYQYCALIASERTNCVAQFVKDAEKRATDLDALPCSHPKQPLHGVPFSLKECFLLEGTEATAGIGSLVGKFRNVGTGPVIQFLIDQGCVPMCKTNLSQALLSFDSRNPIYGITKNPVDLLRSPGGSSSGEGVLLASHSSVLGVGTDIGGSSRIPCAWSGVFCLKPTSLRMISDRGGCEAGSESQKRAMPPDFGAYSFMARDSSTLARVYKLFYSQPTFAKNPELVPLVFRDEIFESDKPLTIGYYYTLPNTVESVPAMKRGVRIAKDALEKCGHKLVEFLPPNPRRALLLELEAIVADGALDIRKALYEDVELSYPNQSLVSVTWSRWFRAIFASFYRRSLGSLPTEALYAMAPAKTPHDLNLTLRKIVAYRNEFLSAMHQADVDAIIGPAFACPACHLNDPRNISGAMVYTCLFNVLNWPAGVVPVTKVAQADQNAMASYPELDIFHRTIKESLSSKSVGLPVAVQIAARPYCEETVLRLMHELEGKLATSLSIPSSPSTP